jgi:hypothetical protein|eukprot:COSAG06_NODE_26125_length_621_cov_0.595785_1_plen_91_part_00
MMIAFHVGFHLISHARHGIFPNYSLPQSTEESCVYVACGASSARRLSSLERIGLGRLIGHSGGYHLRDISMATEILRLTEIYLVVENWYP